jgi:hypothetical protein
MQLTSFTSPNPGPAVRILEIIPINSGYIEDAKKLAIIKGSGKIGEWEYNGGGKLVQSTVYTHTELS